MDSSLKNFLKGDHLPPPLRDFHDQKRVFKRIDEMVRCDIERDPGAKMYYEGLNWSNAHCYTVDKFLWFMAAHGYTLQKSRKKGVAFCDWDAMTADFDKRMTEAFSKMMDETRKEHASQHEAKILGEQHSA